jgi:hypothetical protein
MQSQIACQTSIPGNAAQHNWRQKASVCLAGNERVLQDASSRLLSTEHVRCHALSFPSTDDDVVVVWIVLSPVLTGRKFAEAQGAVAFFESILHWSYQ